LVKLGEAFSNYFFGSPRDIFGSGVHFKMGSGIFLLNSVLDPLLSLPTYRILPSVQSETDSDKLLWLPSIFGAFSLSSARPERAGQYYDGSGSQCFCLTTG
jgi:hypothetical protein